MTNGWKIHPNFAACFKIIIIAMQKSVYISMPETGKNGCKVNMTDMTVSRANAQSRLSGILFAPANSKLCFALLTSFSAAQNHLPRSLAAGGGNALRSRRFIWKNFDMEQALCIASPLKPKKYVGKK
jgi:hypothetical protein